MKQRMSYPIKSKIGDLLSPRELGLKWYDKMYWGVVVKINKRTNRWKEIRYFTCVDCANIFSEGLIAKEKK